MCRPSQGFKLGTMAWQAILFQLCHWGHQMREPLPFFPSNAVFLQPFGRSLLQSVQNYTNTLTSDSLRWVPGGEMSPRSSLDVAQLCRSSLIQYSGKFMIVLFYCVSSYEDLGLFFVIYIYLLLLVWFCYTVSNFTIHARD